MKIILPYTRKSIIVLTALCVITGVISYQLGAYNKRHQLAAIEQDKAEILASLTYRPIPALTEQQQQAIEDRNNNRRAK